MPDPILRAISPRYYLAPDRSLRSKGRPTLFGPVVPNANSVRLTRAKALSDGSRVVVVGPPPPPPVAVRTDAAGALAVGTATYPIPTTGTVRYVDPDRGLDTATGVIGSPWKTLAFAASHVGAGGTIVLRSGTYHEGAVPGQAPGGASNGIYFQTAGVTVQNYPGEEVWFDGSRLQTGWTPNTTAVPGRTVWSKGSWGQFGAGAGIPAFDRSPTAVRGAGDTNTSAGGSWQYIDPAFPIAHWGEQVFVNGVALKQVATLAEVTTGTFFLAGALKGGAGADKNLFAGSTCYIGTDPTGKEVRASDLSCAFILNGANGVQMGITVRGIGVRRYCPALYDNAVIKMQAQGAVLENVHIKDISSTGVTASLRSDMTVRKVTVENCGFRGCHSNAADRILYDMVRVTNCDLRRFNAAPECGGIKITSLNQGIVKRSVVSGNQCHAVWADESVGDFRVLSCDIQGNRGHGIIAEIGEVFIAADNLVTNNGKIGIYTQSTNAARIWCNTELQNGATGECGIDLFDDDRNYATDTFAQDTRPTAFKPMTWVVTSYQQCNNVAGVLSGTVTYMFRTRSNAAAGWRTNEQMGVQSNGNLWVRVGSTPSTPYMIARAGGGTGYTGFSAYRAAYPAQDVNSAFTSSNPCDPDYSLTTAAATTYASVGRPLPADIAAMIGQTAGSTHLGAWL